jgi:hypothetical protein
MPQRDFHELFTAFLTQLMPGGPIKGTAMHAAMDLPSQWLGPNHRAVGHDIYSIILQASTIALQAMQQGQNFWQVFAQNFIAGLSHVALDEGFSAAKRYIGTATPYDKTVADAQAAVQRFVGLPANFGFMGQLPKPPAKPRGRKQA